MEAEVAERERESARERRKGHLFLISPLCRPNSQSCSLRKPSGDAFFPC